MLRDGNDQFVHLISATIPASGALNSNKEFRVLQQLLSFSPTSGPVGASVVITGESFTGLAEVHFGSVKVTSFRVDSDTQITATVPAGATTGNISVCTPSGSSESATDFTVTE
jgi:large repetitive protein